MQEKIKLTEIGLVLTEFWYLFLFYVMWFLDWGSILFQVWNLGYKCVYFLTKIKFRLWKNMFCRKYWTNELKILNINYLCEFFCAPWGANFLCKLCHNPRHRTCEPFEDDYVWGHLRSRCRWLSSFRCHRWAHCYFYPRGRFRLSAPDVCCEKPCNEIFIIILEKYRASFSRWESFICESSFGFHWSMLLNSIQGLNFVAKSQFGVGIPVKSKIEHQIKMVLKLYCQKILWQICQ